MTIVGDGPQLQSYMQRWMKENPGQWTQCGVCENWRLGPAMKPPCPMCPLKPISIAEVVAREEPDPEEPNAHVPLPEAPIEIPPAAFDFDLLEVTGNRLGPTHRNDPPTARAAAEDNFPRSGSQRAQALVLVVKAGDRGLTGYEGSVQMGHPRPHVITTRIEELERDGYVKRTTIQRRTDTGSLAMAWIATEKGRRAARLLEIEP